MTWSFIPVEAVFLVHAHQLERYGGLPGIRDRGVIESAMARPENLAAYGTPDHADLAAAYAFGLARSHGFADGNKRIAWMTARMFLAENGQGLTFDEDEALRVMLDVASGALPEEKLADWFRERITPRS